LNLYNVLDLSIPIIILLGPTAIGKTALSLELAQTFDCEIVSVDSMQVYRFMDIGTAKATPVERATVPHHLIDIIDPDEQYDAARFFQDARDAITRIHSRNKLPLLTGGTGLYLKVLSEGLFNALPTDQTIRDALKKRAECEGLDALHQELALHDQLSAQRIHINDEQRTLRALEILMTTGIPWSQHIIEQSQQNNTNLLSNSIYIGLTCERQTLYSRINHRCRLMLDNGLVEETASLLERGYSKDLNPLQAIGYRHAINNLEGKWRPTETYEFLARDTRRYAKRQYTWFNKIKKIEWYNSPSIDEIVARIKRWRDCC